MDEAPPATPTDAAASSGAPVVDVPIRPVDQDSTGREIIRAAISRSVRTFLERSPGTRTGDDPEDLHQARVSIRRLRSDLRTFSPLLDPAWSVPLREELRWLGGSLGEVRDLDVLDLTLAGLATSSTAIVGSDVDRLRDRFGVERRAARAQLLDDLDGDRAVRLRDALVDAADDPRTAPQADDPAVDTLPVLARGSWRRLERAVRRLDLDPDDASLHAIRIHAKRCRYAAEAVAPAVGRPARRYAKAMAALQECLGDLNDSVVISARLRDLADHEPEFAFVAGQLTVVLARRAEHCRIDVVDVWRRAARPELHAWF